MLCRAEGMLSTPKEQESSPVAGDQWGEVGLEGLGKEHKFHPKHTGGFFERR